MSNAEHLIENAIMDFERNGNFDNFLNGKRNKEMADAVGIDLDDVAAMAVHIVYAFKPDWIQQGWLEVHVKDKAIEFLLDMLEGEHMGMRAEAIKELADNFGIEV